VANNRLGVGVRAPRTALRAVLAAGVLLIVSTSAQAQWFTPPRYYPPVVLDELTPREIHGSLLRQGFNNPSRPVYRDEVVIVSARDRSGRHVRLVLDVYTGRIVGSRALAPPPRPREQVVQRVPDQGPAIRRTVPEPTERSAVTPERPTTIRREPMLPPQAAPPAPPRNRVVQPENQPTAAPRPPEAAAGSGTRNAPRRIDITPPAELDAPPARPVAPTGPPINSVPPAGLE
jgi:resuscitation-promoting factor RpfA